MAGFGTVLAAPVHDAFPGRILNTHPALLPAFPGWHGVRDALAAGVEVTGCTVHVATVEIDAGPILAQEEVAVRADDTVESLHERIKAGRAPALPGDGDPGRSTQLAAGRPAAVALVRRARRAAAMRALLSVYDKRAWSSWPAGLAASAWELVASGETATALEDAGIAHRAGGRGHRLARDAGRAG